MMLIDAIPAVMTSLKRPVHVAMVGDGRERARWESRAREIEQSLPGAQSEFTGWLSQSDVRSEMSQSDLLVVPSLWPEPFGSVGPAAGQLGLPAAAFAVGGISQWLLDGQSGHLAPGNPPTASGLARAIVQCLENPEHYAALRTGAEQMSRMFTMEKHLPELIGVLAGA
jgi:glycosyltransferase involved in cell wall biosynthesis